MYFKKRILNSLSEKFLFYILKIISNSKLHFINKAKVS